MRSTFSTTRISVRPEISSAPRRSGRSREPGCRPARLAHRDRSSSARGFPSEMRTHRRAATWVIAAASLVGWLSVCPALSAQERPVRTVLALYLGEEEFPTNPVTQRALYEGLTSRPDIPVEYFGEFLESARFSDEI